MSAPDDNEFAKRSNAAIEDMLVAAREMFGTVGYLDVTTDAVAAATGRTKGSLYHHFPTKAALFEAVYVREQRRVADVVATAAARRRDPVTAIRTGVRTYLAEVSRADVARVMLVDGPAVLGWQRWRSCDGSPLRSLMLTGLAQVKAERRLRRGLDVTLVADLLMGLIGEAALQLAHQPAEDRDAVRWASQVDHLIAGITTD